MTRGKRLNRFVVAGAAALAALALPAGGLLVWLVILDPFGGGPHPTDADMLAQFRAKRPVFEELVRMVKQDPGLQRLAPDFTRPEDPASSGVSPDRIALYRVRCLEAGVTHGFSHYGDALEFIVHTRGLAISGSGKGFAYRERAEPDATIVESDLDSAAASLPVKDVLLERKIDGNWWLQLDLR